MVNSKRNFWVEYMIAIYHCGMSWLMPRLLSDKKAVIKYYKAKAGREPNLESPQLFSEKLQWYKLNCRLPLMRQCADKYAVREYIAKCGYANLLNDVIGVYSHVSDINFDSMPDRFVLKSTHGSGQNIIVRDKGVLNKRRAKLLMNAWLHQSIYWSGREWVYEKMPRRIIAEKYLEDETGELRDYKFYCFNGNPTFMQLEVGRGTDHNTRNFYDMDWKLLPFGKELPHNPDLHVEKPQLFEQMKSIAAALCKPFQYVRVDLYQVGGKVYFGELTFFPAGGAPDFVPKEYDRIVGDMWTLQTSK